MGQPTIIYHYRAGFHSYCTRCAAHERKLQRYSILITGAAFSITIGMISLTIHDTDNEKLILLGAIASIIAIATIIATVKNK